MQRLRLQLLHTDRNFRLYVQHKIMIIIDKLEFEEDIEMDNRFEFIEKKGLMEGTRIIVDKETGVQYLMAHWTNIGGLTVLVDKDGKPLLDLRYAK